MSIVKIKMGVKDWSTISSSPILLERGSIMSGYAYTYNPYIDLYDNYLSHHGIKGMHWGIRRYQPYTHGQKGVFKNLKRDYKDELKNLKRKKRAAGDDELAVAGIRRQIRDLKKSYRSQRKDIAREFDKENYEDYKQKVVDTGSESEIKKIKKDLTAEQLTTAINRITKLKELDKLNMRDVEAEVKQADAMRKLETLSKVAGTVGSVANAFNGIGNAARTFNLNKREKEQHELNMKKGDEELKKMAESTRFQKNMADKAKYDAENSSATAANQRIKNRQANVDLMKSKWGNDYYDKIRERAETKQQAQKDLELTKLMKKYDNTSSTYKYDKKDFTQKTSIDDLMRQYDKRDAARNKAIANSPIENLMRSNNNPYTNSKSPAFSRLSKTAQAGVKAYEASLARGESKAMAEKRRQTSIISSLSGKNREYDRVPVSVARKGEKDAYQYILNNKSKYMDSTISKAQAFMAQYTNSGQNAKSPIFNNPNYGGSSRNNTSPWYNDKYKDVYNYWL